MRAGTLQHKVAIQAKQFTTDDFGGQAYQWSDVASVWASIEPLSGRELVAAQAVNAETTTRIRMRFLPGVFIRGVMIPGEVVEEESAVPINRIIYKNRYYNVTGVLNPELRNRELIIMASEGLNEG